MVRLETKCFGVIEFNDTFGGRTIRIVAIHEHAVLIDGIDFFGSGEITGFA